MRASWHINYCGGEHGPYVIQLGVTGGRGQIGTTFRSSLPQHRNFKTKKMAMEVKKTLPTPFIRYGVVVDGITVSGVAY